MKRTAEETQVPSARSSLDAATLDKHLVGGIAWTAAARWSSQILSWATLLIVARLLSPSDFGLVGMASVYLGLVNTFSEFGLGSALITLQDMNSEDIAQINTFSAISGAIGFLISCALAIPLGRFFHSTKLPPVVIAMSVAFAIAGFRTVPYSLLQKRFKFKLLSIIDTAAAVSQSLCVLLLAWLGSGYWALVLGTILGTAISTSLNVMCCSQRFAMPRPQSIRHALTFSWQVLIARLSWNFYSDADFLVAGRMLGPGSLGVYTFAWNLANLPVEKVTALVGQVTPAFFSVNQSNNAGLRRYLRALTEALSLVTFPVSVSLALIAPRLVATILGKSWSGVAGPLVILAIYASIRSIAALLSPLLTSVRQTRFVMWNNLGAVVLMTTAFYVGSHWGATGIAWGWIICYPIVAFPLYWRTFRQIAMPLQEYFAAIRPALSATAGMISMILFLRWLLPGSFPPYLALGVEFATGCLAYLLTLWLLHADRMRSFWNLYRNFRLSSETS